MKNLKFSDYKQIKNMSFNQMSRWIQSFAKEIYEEGLHEGESELDNADADQWLSFMRNTPGIEDVTSFVGTDEELEDLIRGTQGVGDVLTERIMKRISKDEQ